MEDKSCAHKTIQIITAYSADFMGKAVEAFNDCEDTDKEEVKQEIYRLCDKIKEIFCLKH